MEGQLREFRFRGLWSDSQGHFANWLDSSMLGPSHKMLIGISGSEGWNPSTVQEIRLGAWHM